MLFVWMPQIYSPDTVGAPFLYSEPNKVARWRCCAHKDAILQTLVVPTDYLSHLVFLV